MYKPLPKQIKIQKSRIEGYGLFAAENILKGTIFGISHIHHDLFPDGWIRTPLGGFYNHSEIPNCELITNNMDEGFLTEIKLLQTIKDVQKDEELTCTYTIWNFEEQYGDFKAQESWLGL